MAKVSFVGFQEKVEIPEGFQLLQIEERLESKKSRDDLYSLLSDSKQLSQWLNEVQSFNSRPGGKMIFTDGSEATCTSFLLGKEVSLISDYFGNFNCKVVKGRDLNSLELNFSILSDDVESKTGEILIIIERLKKLL
ncbi:hypothetical protein MCEMRE182_01366 [Candidatus Nanopelagicaceae bacterium]